MTCPFCSKHTKHLESDLAEARKERDYFRARADRLELLLIPDRRAPLRPANLTPVPRPSWGAVEAAHAQKLAEEAKSKKESN